MNQLSLGQAESLTLIPNGLKRISNLSRVCHAIRYKFSLPIENRVFMYVCLLILNNLLVSGIKDV